MVAAILALCGIGYVVYTRCLHPFAKFPERFTLTEVMESTWHVIRTWEYFIQDLHKKRGVIARIGSSDLAIPSG